MKNLYYVYGSAAARLQRRRALGRSIFDAEWDVCIVLDSARLDMLRAAVDGPVPGAWSVGSMTTEWLSNTFREDVADQLVTTALVSATPHSTTVFRDRHWLSNDHLVRVPFPDTPAVSPDAFAGFYEVWRTHTGEYDAVPPETMRDATIEAAQRHERVVAHWLQPHEPFLAPDAPLVGVEQGQNLWKALQAGSVDEAAVWTAYTATLDYALDYVREVVDHVDGRVLITADHGNAFGEWGVYGHPFAWPQPAVRRVPWLLVDGRGTNAVDYDAVLDAEGDRVDMKKKLRALGYR